jgi:hypothetical protein
MATVKVPTTPVVAPSDPNQYAAWLQAAEQSQYTAPSSSTPTSTINSSGQTVTSVPDSTTPESAQSSFDNVPVYQLVNPSQAPSAWDTTNPGQDIYVGKADAITMGHNQLIGAIADKLKVKQKPGESTQTLEDAVTAQLAKEHNIKIAQAKADNPTTGGGPGLLGQLEGALTGRSAGPDDTSSTPAPAKKTKNSDTDPALTDPSTLLAGGESPQLEDILKGMNITPTPGQDPWEAVANKIGVNTSVSGQVQTVKIAQAEEGIKSLLKTPTQIAALQSQLEAAGMYTSLQQPGESDAYTPGSFDTATQQAFGTLLGLTASANNVSNGKLGKNGRAVTWEDTLNDAIQTTDAAGGVAAITKKSEPTVTKIPQATESQMESPALTAFEARLGRAPTAAELAQLTGDYDTQQQNKYAQLVAAGQQNGTTPAVFNDANGIPSLAGIATPEAYAGQVASTGANAPSEYGHSIANAASILASIIGASPGSQNIEATSAPNATVTPL